MQVAVGLCLVQQQAWLGAASKVQELEVQAPSWLGGGGSPEASQELTRARSGHVKQVVGQWLGRGQLGGFWAERLGATPEPVPPDSAAVQTGAVVQMTPAAHQASPVVAGGGQEQRESVAYMVSVPA